MFQNELSAFVEAQTLYDAPSYLTELIDVGLRGATLCRPSMRRSRDALRILRRAREAETAGRRHELLGLRPVHHPSTALATRQRRHSTNPATLDSRDSSIRGAIGVVSGHLCVASTPSAATCGFQSMT